MRVAFDTSPLVRHDYPAGVRRACRELVECLEERGVLEVVRLSPTEGMSERRWRHRRLPRLVEQERCAGLHSPVSAFPWRGTGRRVQTVHELPWRHGVRENAGPGHRFWASFGSRRADAVLCPTEVVARDLRRSPLVPDARVHVCPWGVNPAFAPGADPNADERRLSAVDLPARPFALCLGAVRPKKNLRGVLRGLAELRAGGAPPWRLVVTGEATATLRDDLALAAELSLADSVHTPGTVAEALLPALVRAAAALVALAPSEGFALPVLEAMACGTPVVVPPGTAQAEVAGEAGIAVDPADPTSVARGLRRAAAEREELHPRLLSRAAGFSWSRCASQVEELWLGWAR